ncbi:sperm-associated antigen 7 [Neocloeon triangulifer]|uniref:sperm-associated antigen 7 n=1 Tax=Neocloeon triangulifer TaxID=2078957 RepID=UPI00286F881A|nr:sperm-associated antigen 7 [Neocloeon triangulifer]
MDLLSSIMNAMDKPPRVNEKEKKAQRDQQAALDKIKQAEKKHLSEFRVKIEGMINDFIKDSSKSKLVFETMDKVHRAVVQDVSDIAGMPAFSFGIEGVDRHVQVFRKETVPSEKVIEEARRTGMADLDEVEEIISEREMDEKQQLELNKTKGPKVVPTKDYKEKYEHLIGKESALDAAKKTITNKQYGFVPAENKKDQRSIEQTLTDIRERKRQKLHHGDVSTASSSNQNPDES